MVSGGHRVPVLPPFVVSRVGRSTRRDMKPSSRCRTQVSRLITRLGASIVRDSVNPPKQPQTGPSWPLKQNGLALGQPVVSLNVLLCYFRPTTEQRYTSSVSTIVISGLAPAAAARTSSSETNW